MVRHVENAVSFEPERVIEPIYTGGDVALSEDGRLLATCLGEDVQITDFATGQRLARIQGDGEVVTCLSLTPSGSHLIVCSRSLAIRTYSLDRDAAQITVGPPRAVKSPNVPVVKTAVDETGTLLATGAADGAVRVWDIRQGYATHTFHGHGSVVSSLRFFLAAEKHKQKGDRMYRLAAGAEDGKLRVWDLETRKSLALLDSHVSVVSSLDYDANTHTLLSASRDRTVTLWDASTWQSKAILPVMELVECAGFLSQHLVFTAGENGQIRVWRTSGEALTKQKTEDSPPAIIKAITYVNSAVILTAHADQTLRIHSKDLPGGPVKPPLELPITKKVSGTHDEVIDLAFVGSGQPMLALATNVEEIRLLSLAQPEQTNGAGTDEASAGTYFGADVGTLTGHGDIVICLDVDWSGHWLLSGAKDNTAKLWRLDPGTRTFECFATFTGHTESIGAVALSKKAPPEDSAEARSPSDHVPALIVTGSQDKTIKRWEVSTNAKTGSRTARAAFTRKAHDKDINAMDVNHNSTLLASASQDRTVKIWSAEEGEVVGVLRGHRRGVWSVRFSPKGTPPIAADGSQASSSRGFALTGSGDRSVKIWSLSDYGCLRTFEGHTNSVLKTVWMDRRPSKAAKEGKTEEEEEEEQEGPSPAVKRGLEVASAGADGLVKVWDVASGESATTLDNHTDRVWALAAQANAKTTWLVSGGGDGVITFWKDTTSTRVALAAAESTARVEQDQELQNLMRAGAYRDAIVLALQLNHPARLLALFTAVTSTFPPEEGSICGVRQVDEVLKQLSDEQLMALLARVRDWNANAKTAPVAQRVLMTLLRTHPPSRLTKLRAGKPGAGVKDVLDALRAYTERHFSRMEELIDESYLVDYTLQEMEAVGGLDARSTINGESHG